MSIVQYIHAKSLQSSLTLFDPMNYSPPGRWTHEILQARILEQLPCPPPGDLPNPGFEPISLSYPALSGKWFIISATYEAPVILYQC